MNSDNHIKEEIRNKLDIVEVIGETLTLTHRGGSEYTGTIGTKGHSGASLKVDRNKQVYNDMKNGNGGDVFDWFGYVNGLDTKGADFPEVLKLAAEKAGVALPEMKPGDLDRAQERAEVQGLLTDAAGIYHGNLKPEHYIFIKEKWGITQETVDRLKIGYSTPGRDLVDLDRETLKKSGLVYVNNMTIGGEVFRGRYIFPYWKGGKVVYFIGRETEETPENERNKGMKYRKQPVHKEKCPYISETVENGVFYGEDSLRGADSCILTEGVTDCITMLQAGLPCISPVTVQFREKDYPKLLDLTRKLKRVYICNDNEENEAGLKGALKTAGVLEGAGIETRLIELPRPEGLDKIDLAEYMKDHSPEDFRGLMGEAVGLWDFKLSRQPVPVKALERLRAFEAFISQDLDGMKPGEWNIFVMNEAREHFKLKRGEVKDIVAENRPTTTIRPNQAADEAQEIPTDFKRFYEVKINRGGEAVIKLIHSEIAAHLSEKNNVVSYMETLYIYRGGVYTPGEVELKAEAQAIIKVIDFKGSITEATREIIHYMTYENPETAYPFNEYGNIIPMENGLLKLNFEDGEVELIPHSPEYKFNFKLPISYDPTADPGPIDKVIRGYVDPDEREGDNGKGETVKLGYSDANLLYQIPAQALLQMTGAATFKKAYLLQGDAHAGKSSYLELLKQVFGEANLSDVSLQALVSDRFALADLEGRLLNCYDDLADIPLREGGVFKTVTGKYLHRIQRKGKQGYNAIIKAVHVYTCNKAPTFNDSIANDTAFWERWEFINFTNLFGIDPFFYERTFTRENIAGFFNMVLKTAMEIKKTGQLLIDSAAGEVREKWQSNADPLYNFIEGQFNRETTKIIYLDKTEFLHSYKIYCMDRNVDPGKIPSSLTMFTKLLFKYEVTTKQVKLEDGRQPWLYCLPYSWVNENGGYYVKPIAESGNKTKQGTL